MIALLSLSYQKTGGLSDGVMQLQKEVHNPFRKLISSLQLEHLGSTVSGDRNHRC